MAGAPTVALGLMRGLPGKPGRFLSPASLLQSAPPKKVKELFNG